MKKRCRPRKSTTRRKIDGVFDSKLEKVLHTHWKKYHEKEEDTHKLVPQHKFHPSREWQFDFAFPEAFIAIEIQGFGTGHTSYEGMKRDYEKHNAAMTMGWGIIYLMSSDLVPLKISATCAYIQTILEHRIKNGAFLSLLKEMGHGHTPVQKGSTRRVNHLNEARRKLLKGTDNSPLPPRPNQILRKGWPFDE